MKNVAWDPGTFRCDVLGQESNLLRDGTQLHGVFWIASGRRRRLSKVVAKGGDDPTQEFLVHELAIEENLYTPFTLFYSHFQRHNRMSTLAEALAAKRLPLHTPA
jgi:hypothetical protein